MPAPLDDNDEERKVGRFVLAIGSFLTWLARILPVIVACAAFFGGAWVERSYSSPTASLSYQEITELRETLKLVKSIQERAAERDKAMAVFAIELKNVSESIRDLKEDIRELPRQLRTSARRADTGQPIN